MITVGRLSLPDPKSPQITPENLSFSGLIHTETQAVTNARQRQIVGMKDQLVPVVWTPGEINGFYRVTEASCDIVYVTASRSAMRFSFSLEFVSHAPDFESLLVGAQVPNDHGITGQPWWAPGANTSLDVDSASTVIRAGEDGNTTVHLLNAGVTSGRRRMPPSTFYDNAVTVTVGDVVVGTHAPNVWDWSLSNGLVKVSNDGVSLTTFLLAVYDAGWESKRWRTQVDAVAWDMQSVSVVANSPQFGAVKFTGTVGGERVTLTLSLRRGSRLVVGVIQARSAHLWNVGPSTAEAATAISGGIHATVNDAAGNRFVAGSPDTFTSDLVNGNITSASTLKFAFVVGAQVSAGTGETAAELLAQSMHHYDERVRPVKI